MKPEEIKVGHTYEVVSGYEWTVLSSTCERLRVHNDRLRVAEDNLHTFADAALLDITLASAIGTAELLESVKSIARQRDDLLAALKAIVQHQDAMGGAMASLLTVRRIAADAIQRVEGKL